VVRGLTRAAWVGEMERLLPDSYIVRVPNRTVPFGRASQ
jgi:hypothetical protein